MISLECLFETHITVNDLQRSIGFYRDVVGLEIGIVQPERPAAFFWVGGRGRSMLGISALGSCPLTMRHHLSFQVKLEDLLAAPLKLRSAGLTPLGGSREPIDEPVVFAWGPAASVFFDDPDGNLLEYISMLPDPRRPELELVSWSKLQALQENRRD